jgi:acyl carrier protein
MSAARADDAGLGAGSSPEAPAAGEPVGWRPPEAGSGFDDFAAWLGDQLDVGLAGVSPEDRLVDDLGLDSIALFRLLVVLEDVAPHELPVELLDSLETLADVWHWCTNLAGQRQGTGAGSRDAP